MGWVLYCKHIYIVIGSVCTCHYNKNIQYTIQYTKGTFRVPSTLSLDREWWKMAYTVLAAQGLIIYGLNDESAN